MPLIMQPHAEQQLRLVFVRGWEGSAQCIRINPRVLVRQRFVKHDVANAMGLELGAERREIV